MKYLKTPPRRHLQLQPFRQRQRQRQRQRSSLPLLWPVLLAVAPLSLHAQRLEEVVVSASRTEQRSFDAPAAVQSLGREALQNAGPQVNLSEALVRVPGLTILDRENYAQDLQLSIRGFGARASFGLRGIRLLVDGIPATTPDGQAQGSSVSLTSMQRIEVLRGPLAQLYGNAAGGVIQAFTRAAPPQPELSYQNYTGSYGLHRADYQFGDAGLGLVADYSAFSIDGYRSNSAAERKQFNGKLELRPNEQTQLNVVFNQFDMPLAQDALGLMARQLAADPTQAGTGALSNATRKSILQNQLGSSATYRIDAQSSLQARAYAGTRDNLQYQAGATWTGLNRSYYGLGLQYQQETQWDDMPVAWSSGYEFDRSREYRQGGTSSAGQKTGLLNRSEDNQAENSDWFAQGNWMLSDLVTLTGGLRYSSVRFASQDYFLSDAADGSGSSQFSAASPVFGITLHASDTLNVYANLGKGFETPTLAEVAYQNGTPTTRPVLGMFNPTLNASSSRHIEMGSKWLVSPDTRLDFAVYQIDTVDEIVASVSSGGQTTYQNAPGTQRSGWELSLSSAITQNLSWTFAAGSIDAHYTQSYTSQTVSSSGVITNVNVASGNKLPGIPQTSMFSELAWSSEPTPARKGAPAMGTRLAFELIHSGRLYANDTNADSADGHGLLNLSASQFWPVASGQLALYARVNNATDEKYVSSVIVNQSSAQYYEPGLPRNWSLGLNLVVPM